MDKLSLADEDECEQEPDEWLLLWCLSREQLASLLELEHESLELELEHELLVEHRRLR